MIPHTLTTVSAVSKNGRVNIVLWIVAWMLHLPKPVVTILNESRGPLLGILYRSDNLLLTLNMLLLISCLLMAINLYRGLARLGMPPFRQILFWILPIAMFILPVFSAIGAMLWLRGKQLAVEHKKFGVSLRVAGIFLVIVGWMFWINSVPCFQGYRLRSVIIGKILAADQAVQIAASALKDHDLKLARQEIERGKELLRQAASYRYPHRELRRVELALHELEQAAQAPAKEQGMEKLSESVSDFAQYVVSQGWTAADGTNQGDPQAALTRGMHTIKIRLSGGPSSRYKLPEDFLAGFEARSHGGKPGEKLDWAVVSGLRILIYQRTIAVRLPPPDAAGPISTTPEEFCVVPTGNRFFILKYFYGDSTPDPTYDGQKAWRQFLKDFRLKKKTSSK